MADEIRPKRDEHGQLDRDDADRIARELTERLITEQRAFQKEISFKNARTNRRDIVVKTIIYQRNTINGMIVKQDADDPLFESLGEDLLDPMKYKYFDHIDGEIFVREQPMKMATCGKWLMGMFKALTNYLARMNIFDGV